MRRSAVGLLGLFAYYLVMAMICGLVGSWSHLAFWPVFLILAGIGVWLAIRYTRMVWS